MTWTKPDMTNYFPHRDRPSTAEPTTPAGLVTPDPLVNTAAKLRKFRISQLSPRRQDVFSLLHYSYGKTLPELCVDFEEQFNIPISVDDMEKCVSDVVDADLATRSIGQREVAEYRLVSE